MDSVSIIAEVKRRLVKMADDPPYVFCDTPAELIEQEYRRLTNFLGYSEAEVCGAEERLGGRLPEVFRTYLREMGRSPGELFCGSDLVGIGEFEDFRADALVLIAKKDRGASLPPEAVVFLFHQGYTFLFLRAVGGFDGPVFQYMERETELRETNATFAGLIEAELTLMERVERASHENGGYYRILYPEGGGSEIHSGDRPLDRERLKRQ